MDLSVTRSGHGLVPPGEPTPRIVLDLSIIDRVPVLRCNARTLHVFRHGGLGAAQAIRKALSKALVPYYPLAGRLKNDNNLLQVECSGEGVWFVEASADRTLVDVNYFEDANSIQDDKLLPDDPPQGLGLDPLVLVQITQFACDGFVMGLVFSHAICDGLGAAQFLKAVGEMARSGNDQQQLSITPVWSRDFVQILDMNAKVNMAPPPIMPSYQLEHATVDVPLKQINELKQEYFKSSSLTAAGAGEVNYCCSSFEIVAATLWCNRTRAIIDLLTPDTQVNLVFFANCRHLLNPALPQGFYGNCFFPVTVTAPSGKLVEATSVAEVVGLIQEAKAGLPSQFAKWIKGELGVDPFAPPLTYTTLFVSEWGRLGFNEVDYGWGPPVHVIPIQGSSIIPAAILGSLGSPRKGIRIMTWCVQKAHLPALLRHMNKN